MGFSSRPPVLRSRTSQRSNNPIMNYTIFYLLLVVVSLVALELEDRQEEDRFASLSIRGISVVALELEDRQHRIDGLRMKCSFECMRNFACPKPHTFLSDDPCIIGCKNECLSCLGRDGPRTEEELTKEYAECKIGNQCFC